MVEPAQRGATPGETTLRDGLDARLASIESGNYHRSVANAVGAFVDYMANEERVYTMEQVTGQHLFEYAIRLKKRARDDKDISARSARTYFDMIRATFSWWVKAGYIDANPAESQAAVDELPTSTEDPDRQFWDPETRDEFLQYLDAQAEASLDGEEGDRIHAYRDRAVGYLLVYSGARGAELFRDASDDRRNGLRWENLDLENGVLQVIGKSAEDGRQEVPLSERAHDVVERYLRVLDPVSDDWPVIPSVSARVVNDRIRETLTGRGWDADDIEDLLDEQNRWSICREYDVTPKALSTASARRLVKKRSTEAEVAIDGEYLKPHGARRGLGDQLYQENPVLAQKVLRHNSIETTHESYSDRRAERTREEMDDVLDE